LKDQEGGRAANELREKLAMVSSERDALQEELKKEKAKAADAVARSFEQKMAASKEIKKFESEKIALEEQLAQEKKNISGQLSKTESRESDLRKEIAALNNEKKDLTSKIDTMNKELSDQKAARENRSAAELSRLTEEKKALEAKLADSEARIKALGDQTANLKAIEKEKNDNLKKLQESEKLLASANESLGEMKKALALKDQEGGRAANELREKLAMVSSERDALQEELKKEKAKAMSAKADAGSKISLDTESRDRNIHEARIEVLQVSYGRDDEIEKGLLALEVHQEVTEGITFETAAKKRQGAVKLLEMSMKRLPEWVREKLADIKPGEISHVLSSESTLLIVRMADSRPSNIRK
jgi:chromosome segregation ATPase